MKKFLSHEYRLINIWVDQIVLNNITNWCEYQYDKESYRLWSIGFSDMCYILHFYCDKKDDLQLFKLTWSDVIHDDP